MKTDIYTKFILTMLALSTSLIAIQLSIKDSHAQSGRFLFTQGGALIVSICDSNSSPGRYNCAEVSRLER